MPVDAPDWTTGTQPNQRVKLYPDGTPPSSMGPAPTFPSFSVGASATLTQTFTLLPSQTNLRIENVGSTKFGLTVTGHQTGELYIPGTTVDGLTIFSSANSPFRPIDIRIEQTWDTQVDIKIVELSANATKIYVSALFGSETTILAGATSPIPVFSLPGTPSMPAQTKPQTPDWQVNVDVTGAGGPASTATPAFTGKATVLYRVTFSVTANAGRVFRGRVWDGPSGGTRIGVVVMGSNGAAAGPTSLSESLEVLASSFGNALTFDFDFAAVAGELQAITASGYFN